MNIYNITFLKGTNITLAEKCNILASMIACISFFLPWILENEKWFSWNGFSSIAWNIGWIMIWYIILITFTSTSHYLKEKLKLSLGISIKSENLVLFMWFFILATSVVYINIINGLYIFLENISIWKGVIFYIIAWVIFIVGGIIGKKHQSQGECESFINEKHLHHEENIGANKKNMKLPF